MGLEKPVESSQLPASDDSGRDAQSLRTVSRPTDSNAGHAADPLAAPEANSPPDAGSPPLSADDRAIAALKAELKRERK
jgi:hypothetical protein